MEIYLGILWFLTLSNINFCICVGHDILQYQIMMLGKNWKSLLGVLIKTISPVKTLRWAGAEIEGTAKTVQIRLLPICIHAQLKMLSIWTADMIFVKKFTPAHFYNFENLPQKTRKSGHFGPLILYFWRFHSFNLNYIPIFICMCSLYTLLMGKTWFNITKNWTMLL